MPQQKQPNPFFKYGNMAIQMAVVIGLSVWGGKELDEHYHTKKPYYTIALSLIGIGASLYLTLKDLINPKK
ncbi:MAG: AtpZ/AtpI family protein [Bacteroidia bacterium]|nr:AtpZ/AtpI family protein [Bacteroidia bacterium]